MLQRFQSHLRGNVVAYVAIAIALSAGGGYAVAATGGASKTITACAAKSTGLLYLHTKGRCAKGQTRVTWNQQGPIGPTGPAGQSVVGAFAIVDYDGSILYGNGVSAQLTAPGTYTVTITNGCAKGLNVLTVTASLGSPSVPLDSPGTFPYAWWDFGSDGNLQFVVHAGLVTNGVFAAQDRRFSVIDACELSGSNR